MVDSSLKTTEKNGDETRSESRDTHTGVEARTGVKTDDGFRYRGRIEKDLL